MVALAMATVGAEKKDLPFASRPILGYIPVSWLGDGTQFVGFYGARYHFRGLRKQEYGPVAKTWLKIG